MLAPAVGGGRRPAVPLQERRRHRRAVQLAAAAVCIQGVHHTRHPRQLTPEEARQRDLELAQQAAQREAEEAQYRRDMELLRLYKSASDVERARDRRIATIESAIATTESNIQRLRTQQRNLETRAADAERAGVAVRPELIENLRIIEDQIEERQAEIANRRQQIAEITRDYAADTQRLRYLLGDDGEDELAAEHEAQAADSGDA